MSPQRAGVVQDRGWLLSRVILFALGLNVLVWIAAAQWPAARDSWRWLSLSGVFLLGFVIGRWWALLVTCAFGVIHAIPVYLGLLPGYLSSWGEALWWAFALSLLVALTALGVLARAALRWLQRRFAY
jgi:hypothetical protein